MAPSPVDRPQGYTVARRTGRIPQPPARPPHVLSSSRLLAAPAVPRATVRARGGRSPLTPPRSTSPRKVGAPRCLSSTRSVWLMHSGSRTSGQRATCRGGNHLVLFLSSPPRGGVHRGAAEMPRRGGGCSSGRSRFLERHVSCALEHCLGQVRRGGRRVRLQVSSGGGGGCADGVCGKTTRGVLCRRGEGWRGEKGRRWQRVGDITAILNQLDGCAECKVHVSDIFVMTTFRDCGCPVCLWQGRETREKNCNGDERKTTACPNLGTKTKTTKRPGSWLNPNPPDVVYSLIQRRGAVMRPNPKASQVNMHQRARGRGAAAMVLWGKEFRTKQPSQGSHFDGVSEWCCTITVFKDVCERRHPEHFMWHDGDGP